MKADALTIELSQAQSREQWVEIVAAYFDAHDLVYGHGTDTAADEAYWLVWQLSGTPDELAGLAVDPQLAARVAAIAKRRVSERLPLAYLLGSAYFAGFEFEVGAEVLVPRSPMAELIEQGFEPWCQLTRGDRVLEIGTGSGCIAIAIALLLDGVAVDATEIDPAALKLAARNIERHGVGDRVQLIEADLFPAVERRYRVIISNPPYVPTADVRALPVEYQHEPTAALDGGADGLDIVRRILTGAGQRLLPDGVLIVEVGLTWDALQRTYGQVPWTWIEFERGGEGVFVLTADELKDGWR